MITNFVEKMTEAINEIHEMNMECVNDFGEEYANCFPAMATKIIEINGKTYLVKIEFTIK